MTKAIIAPDQLRSYVSRIERMIEEREALNADIREIYAEAKGTGFCTKTIRKIVALRKLDKADYQEQEALLDMYKDAVGLDGLPVAEFMGAPAEKTLNPKLVERVAQAVQTPAGIEALKSAVDTMVEHVGGETGEISVLDGEALYSAAIAIFVRDRKASASYIQRKLQLGYNSASSIIERMEREGIISSPDHKGVRTILTPEPVSESNEIPAQDSGGSTHDESLGHKSEAARPASVDAHVNDGGLAGQANNEVVTAGRVPAPSSMPEIPAFLRRAPAMQPAE
jgi:uncharacterized protein (UPF0335 family)